MTSTALHAHTDAELLDRAEQGDESAFTALYRRHYAATRRLAYTYLLRGNPDDLVDATFGEVVDGLRAHRRPADSFGLHLFSTLRRLAGQRPDDAPPGVTGEVPAAVAAVAGRQALGGTDRSTITEAFSALGERWQVVVWHTFVDGCDATELSYRLGVSPRAAGVQAQRAESKLRQAYLDAHLRVAPRPSCHPHRERLAALHRRARGGADAEATRAHLERCDSCSNLVADFDRLDERLAWAVVPLFPCVPALGASSAPLAIGFTGQDIGLLDPAGSTPWDDTPIDIVDSPAHRDLSRRAAIDGWRQALALQPFAGDLHERMSVVRSEPPTAPGWVPAVPRSLTVARVLRPLMDAAQRRSRSPAVIRIRWSLAPIPLTVPGQLNAWSRANRSE